MVAHGLMFHRLCDGQEWPAGQGALSALEFEAVLKQVGIERIVTPDVWMARLKAGTLNADDVCITFDDGLHSQYAVALPVLEKYRLKAFWFVYSCVLEGSPVLSEMYSYLAARYFKDMPTFTAAFLQLCPAEIVKELEGAAYRDYAAAVLKNAPFYSSDDIKFRFVRNRLPAQELSRVLEALAAAKGVSLSAMELRIWLSKEQIKELSASGHAIGLHSHDHPFELARLSVQEQQRQYEKNRRCLEEICGSPVVSMSHPLNSYNDQTLGILLAMGVECGFRANMQAPKGKGVNPGPLEMAREDGVNILKQMDSV